MGDNFPIDAVMNALRSINSDFDITHLGPMQMVLHDDLVAILTLTKKEPSASPLNKYWLAYMVRNSSAEQKRKSDDDPSFQRLCKSLGIENFGEVPDEQLARELMEVRACWVVTWTRQMSFGANFEHLQVVEHALKKIRLEILFVTRRILESLSPVDALLNGAELATMISSNQDGSK